MTESAQVCNVSCTNAPKPIQLITFIYAYFYAPHHNSRKSRDNLGTAWFWVSRMQRSIIRNTNGLFALRFAIRCWTRAERRRGTSRGILCNLAAHWQARFKNWRLGCTLLHNNFIFLVWQEPAPAGDRGTAMFPMFTSEMLSSVFTCHICSKN